MSEQEYNYSIQEINGVWNDLKSAEKELEQFENKDSEKKKELVIRIRNSVRILVANKKIPIKKSLTKLYIQNILVERGVSYSNSHLSELFENDEKRNYSKSTQGHIHEHEFNIISDNKNGKWEQCDCGVNKINDIIQIDQSLEDEDNSKKISVRETIDPAGIEFEYLKLVKELFSQNIHAIDTIIQNCTLDITSIKNQNNKHKREAKQIAYDKLYNNTKSLVDKRILVVQNELKLLKDSDIAEKKKSLADIINAIKKVNDRTKTTNYEKAVAKILINKFEYFVGDIAGILNVTTKHVKNNILKLNATNPSDQDSMLDQLDFLARCPGCGLGVADHYDKLHEQWRKGKSIEGNFKLDSFPFPTFAEQVIQLKQKNRNQKIMLLELTERLKKK